MSHFLDDYYFEQYLDGHKHSLIYYIIGMFVWPIRDRILREICHYRGHNIHCVEDWATPDTGGETHECSRCGWRKTIHYY